jgi:hypothetical protein
MTYHVIVTRKRLDELRPTLNHNYLPEPTEECFYAFEINFYEAIVDKRKSVYSGFLLNRMVEMLMRDFNKRFTNIKVVSVLKQRTETFLNHERIATKYFLYNRWKTLVPLTSLYFISLRLSPKYTPKARFHLYVPLVQIFRTYSPMYRYDLLYNEVIGIEPTIPSFLKSHLNSGLQREYGSWCNLTPTLGEFMLLDNPAIVNKATSEMFSDQYYGSNLFREISKIPVNYGKEVVHEEGNA